MESAGKMVATDGDTGRDGHGFAPRPRDAGLLSYLHEDTRPRSIEDIHPHRISSARNVGSPTRSGTARARVRRGRADQEPTRKGGPHLRGTEMVHEAKASRRKARGIHNPLDKDVPDPKGC